MKVLVTGSKGFVGRNLCAVLRRREGVVLFEYDLEHPTEGLDLALGEADVIVHLAGVNRPQNPEDFQTGNFGSIDVICKKLEALGRTPKVILSSSIQAELENPYGVSKRLAENVLGRFSEKTGAECVVFRFKNLFGKWCQPNYNSVTATFCHNIAHDLPIQISNPANEIELTHIDEVVAEITKELLPEKPGFRFATPLTSTRITLGVLADKIKAYKRMRTSLLLPDFSDPFERALYGTYLSYLDGNNLSYGLDIKKDPRGSLAEFLKSPKMGQVFVSRTKPDITRGDHYHHTKTEKFLVLQGTAIIRFRHITNGQVLEYHVRGEDYRVLDIPPGYTHSIENIGQDELVTLFWANEPFNSNHPDTYYEPVQKK